MPPLDMLQAGSAVAIRVGANIRAARIRLGMTQSQLAAPEFSISYISAIERGKIRPSLKALSLLALRLNIPLTFLLEGSATSETATRMVGYTTAPSTSQAGQQVDHELLQADVLSYQGNWQEVLEVLTHVDRMSMNAAQAYYHALLLGRAYVKMGDYQKAVIDLRAAVTYAENMKETVALERARNLLGEAHFFLGNYTLARENELACLAAIESGHMPDPLFLLDVSSNLANTYYHMGDMNKAFQFAQQALQVHDELLQDGITLAQKYLEMSQHYAAQRSTALASDYGMRSLALYKLHMAQKQGGILHHSLGKAFEKQRMFEEAEREYRIAIASSEQLYDSATVSMSLSSLAELLLQIGKTQEAEEAIQSAMNSANVGKDALTQAQSLLVMAQIRHQARDTSTADNLFSQALALLESLPMHDLTAEAYFRFANALEERGEVHQSLNAIKKAYEYQQRSRGSAFEVQGI